MIPEHDRLVASNLLWSPQGVLSHPLLRLAADGRVLGVTRCDDPDRRAATEFRAGVVVPDFPADWRECFARLCAQRRPLTELLPRCCPAPQGVTVVISGIDYATWLPTPAARIERL